MPAPYNMPTVSSPRRKRLASSIVHSSPKCAFAAAALVVAAVDPNPCQRIMTPPSINKIYPSPSSTLLNVFTSPSVPAAKAKVSVDIVMLGLVPKT